MVEIVILAMVAVFLALRLYAVLGKRTGHEQTFVAPVEPVAGTMLPPQGEEMRTITAAAPENVFEPDAAAGIRAIIAGEGNFDVARFLDGAKSAYRMILEAFWRGEEAEYAPYVGDDVREAFATAIAARADAGHVLNNRLVAIESAMIVSAEVTGKDAQIVVRFVAYISAVTRDSDQRVIAGSVSDAVPTRDDWTFARTLRSNDPNWILIDTEASA